MLTSFGKLIVSSAWEEVRQKEGNNAKFANFLIKGVLLRSLSFCEE